ncbi:hypothetical protein NPIL_558391 [Nephila pilipes]|uniref:Uncharacterized protein n=1 Tax=Nephila pilipes TaxID=299642 RepID=A0A8X6QYZ4_NEPPI|nr:hypothetical protein NPIL_558391 [Nephila pilipes]
MVYFPITILLSRKKLGDDPDYPNIPLQIDSSSPPSPRQPKSTHLPTHPEDSLPCTWNGPKESTLHKMHDVASLKVVKCIVYKEQQKKKMFHFLWKKLFDYLLDTRWPSSAQFLAHRQSKLPC